MHEKLELLLHYGLLTPARKLEFVEARPSLRCKTRRRPNNVKPTHLCCDIVKQTGVW
jgi:hypothetical protein